MIIFIQNIMEFERELGSEKERLEYLIKMRYADEVYDCPSCLAKRRSPL
jgi:hypothetical protein